MKNLSSHMAKILFSVVIIFFIGKVMATENFIYSETFGDNRKPAIILNAGAGNQAITWPDEFCKQLEARGYFVIRYDYRDCGLSSAVDFSKHPYNTLDLAEDAIDILARYKVKQAHFVGFSMGGQVAQFVAAYKAASALSIVLIGTSIDFKPGFDAFAGVDHLTGLSAPNKDYIAWATRELPDLPQNLDEKIKDYVTTWRLLDGNSKDYDADFFAAQAKQVYSRSKLQTPYINHSQAMQASFKLHADVAAKIKVPTLIIHGKQDPVFPPDHAYAMHKAIKNSKLLLWDNFAHAISPQNFTRLVDAIDEFIKSQDPTYTKKTSS